MNPQNVTDMLEPLRDPAAVGWWPPAPGWWLLALLLLVVLLLALRLAWQAWARGAPLRGAQQELARIAASDAAAVERATALARLQRRVAIAVAGRRRSAGLTGADWIEFLNGLARTDTPCFDTAVAKLAYRPVVSDAEVDDVVEATRTWLAKLERPR